MSIARHEQGILRNPKTDVTHYYAKLGLSDKGYSIKGLVVSNSLKQEPLDLPNFYFFLQNNSFSRLFCMEINVLGSIFCNKQKYHRLKRFLKVT